MSPIIFDRLTYTDKIPRSRIERLLYEILKKQGGGGGTSIVVDDPSDVGNGLKIQNETIVIDAEDTVTDSNKPITSGAIKNQLDMIDIIMSNI